MPAKATVAPTQAPPPPRAEKVGVRAGFVWIGGRWDWKGKWVWVAGHWDREKKGKQWRPGRWDHKDNKWVFVDGEWIDANATPPAPPAPPAPPPGADWPTSPPPPPRTETANTRRGFVWVTGQWDWKDHKWQWVAGHYEREKKGKRWRPSRWEQRDGHWQRFDGDWEDDVAGPTSAPPPPRAEKPGNRAGFVWVSGQWDWKDNKWAWVAGHYEREQKGKRWRPSRWEQREGRWTRVDGDWENDNTPPLPPNGNPGPLPPHLPPRHEWKLERPVVSSYWPAKGKAGTKVVIHGKNFPKDVSVLFGGQQVKAAKITPQQIAFIIPASATTGQIALQTGRRRAMAVGNFEVAASYDPIAEQKRIDAERKKAAQAAWNARQAKLAKDRAAREAAWRERQEQREATREQRRAERIAEIQARWKRAFLADDDTQDELTLHAQRMAEIVRMRDLADLTANAKLAVRIEVALSRENDRHDRRMTALQASFQAGGNP